MSREITQLVPDYFQGRWRYRRFIDNGATAFGEVHFTRAGKRALRYFDRGTLALANGQEFSVFKGYLFEFGTDQVDVYFDEMPQRLFHTLMFLTRRDIASAIASHLCGSDYYNTAYHITSNSEFHIRHSVIGPRKRYRMRTVHQRIVD